MTEFNDAEISALIKKKRTCDGITYLVVAILIIASIIAAVLSKQAYENYLGADRSLYLAALIVAVMCLLFLVAHLIFFVSNTNGQLNYAIAKKITSAFLNNKELLESGGKAEFEVSYENDILTVTRVNFKRGNAPSPVTVTASGISSVAAGTNCVRFDISALKILPSVYGAFGTRILAFIQAYYGVKGVFDEVTVTDNTGNKPAIITVVKEGKPCGNAEKNYYIKKGLIK